MLDFPYKDCILEGGQTKDDQKRAEIFYNEILAPEQVTNLLAPKAFCNAKRYDTKGEHKIDSISQNDNLIIKGNNLIALSSLLERYRGKVKCIYIDPPYNTGSDSFGYNDNFNHSTWLVFMKNRLELARKLLRDDGAIFVQCDDNEQAYLKVLMDEIFGRENFVSTVCVKMSTVSGVKTAHREKTIIKEKEFLTVFTKNVNEIRFHPQYIPMNEFDTEFQYVLNKHDSENSDKWEVEILKDVLERNNIPFDVKNEKFLTFVYTHKDIIWRRAFIRNEYKEISQNNPNKIFFINTTGQEHYYYRGREMFFLASKFHDCFTENGVINQTGNLLGDIWSDINTAKLFSDGDAEFRNGKKTEFLIARILQLSTNPSDIVLDFHLGSGTTAAVAHKMGRQYIGVEQMDYIQTIAVERLKKVIAGEQGGISKAQSWQGGGSFVYCELASLNASYVERISSCKTESEIVSLIEEILQSDFVSSAVLPSKIDTNAADFKALSFDDKKRFALDILDKNLLYINEADMDDESENHKTLEMSDRKFTRSFYGKDGTE